VQQSPKDHHGNFNVSRVVNLSVGMPGTRVATSLGLDMMTMFSTCFFGLDCTLAIMGKWLFHPSNS